MEALKLALFDIAVNTIALLDRKQLYQIMDAAADRIEHLEKQLTESKQEEIKNENP